MPAQKTTITVHLPKPRNPVARDLRTPQYRTRVVKPRRGDGSYTRKGTDNQKQEG